LEFGRASEHDSDQTITALGWKHGPQAFVAKRRQGAIFSIKGLSKPIRLSEINICQIGVELFIFYWKDDCIDMPLDGNSK
jgi:hypothetical protein